MQSSSTKNLRVRSTSGKSPAAQTMSPKKKFDHKKQIEATLNQLHQLQAQIYNLNVPQNPHSNGPMKKQIKQLSYLYESMTKPKIKNKLSVPLKDIKAAIKVMNQGMQAILEKSSANTLKKPKQSQKKAVQISLMKQFALVQQKQEDQGESKISTKSLKQLMKQMYGTEFDLSLVSETKTARVNELSAEEIQKFINYNEHDQFDPLEQAYNCLLDDNKKFSFKRYNEVNKMFGLPEVKELAILKSAIGANEEITFEVFKRVMSDGDQLGFA